VIEAFMSGYLSKTAPRRLGRLGLVGALAALAAPAICQTAPVTYPPSRSLNDIAAWLQRDTPIAPNQIVDISPQAVTAVTSASPMGETRGFLANISSESVDPEMLSHDGVASWSIPVEIDCDKRLARLGVMTGYRSRDLRSDPRVVRDADTDWVNPASSAPLGSVIKALCDRDFHRPLMGHGKTLAATPEKPKAVAKANGPPPAPRPTLPAPPAPTPLEVAKAKPPAPARAPAAAPTHAGGGAFTVQVGASPSLADTQGLLTRFKKTFASHLGGLTPSVATVQVGGKTVNRALVSGFSSSAEADAFCKTLAAAGQACFIRR
jgi:cell division septation protein DedD